MKTKLVLALQVLTLGVSAATLPQANAQTSTRAEALEYLKVQHDIVVEEETKYDNLRKGLEAAKSNSDINQRIVFISVGTGVVSAMATVLTGLYALDQGEAKPLVIAGTVLAAAVVVGNVADHYVEVEKARIPELESQLEEAKRNLDQMKQNLIAVQSQLMN